MKRGTFADGDDWIENPFLYQYRLETNLSGAVSIAGIIPISAVSLPAQNGNGI